MANVLIVATYGGFFSSFEVKNILNWKKRGAKVFLLSNFTEKQYNRHQEIIDSLDVSTINYPFSRSLKKTHFFKTIRFIKRVITTEKIDIVETQNPIVSALVRIACCRTSVRCVIYTVHGFFFYKGCPLRKRLFFKPIETILAKKTDIIVTTNLEDYEYSKKLKPRVGSYYVHGVGIECDAIMKEESNRIELCKELGLPTDSFLCVSVGECIKRKNHSEAIRAISKLKSYSDIHYLIIGDGSEINSLKQLSSHLEVDKNVHFLGYRNDANRIMKSCDLYLFPSIQEGLSVALMQAMACGLPVVCSRIRGNVDCIIHGEGGYTYSLFNECELSQYILECYNNRTSLKSFGIFNTRKSHEFSCEVVQKEMSAIYDKAEETLNSYNQ